MKPKYIAFMLVVLSGALGVWMIDRQDQRSEMPVRGASRSAQSSGEAVRREVAREYARSLPRVPVALPARVISSTNEAEVDPPQPLSEAKAQPSMAPEEVRLRLDQIFQRESIDRVWMSQALTTARAKLTQILPASSKLRAIECRDSMCRFETAHQEPESYRQFLISAFQDPATKLWNGGGFSTPLPDRDADGRVVTVAYLARDGQSLPFVWQEE